jgi:hypothetical protein
MTTPPGYPPQPGDPHGVEPGPTSGAPTSTEFGYPEPGTYPSVPPPRRRRTGLIVGIVLAVVLVACGGGGIGAYLVLRNAGGDGQPSPSAATVNFLTAVLKEKNVDKASKYVCSAARDPKLITKKIDELRQYEQKFNRDPRFSWDEPKVENATDESAKVSVTIRFNTSDDRTAEQRLTITAVKNSGWYVCDIQTVS